MEETTRIKLQIPIAFNKPNANGCIYSEQAVKNAVYNLNKYLPILYNDSQKGEIVIGATGNQYAFSWDDETKFAL